jgi:hypothetical protein
MSQSYSRASEKLSVLKYVGDISVLYPGSSLTATGVSQRLEIGAQDARAFLEAFVTDGYLNIVPVQRCENAHLCPDALDEGETEGVGNCLQCGKCNIQTYATYLPTAALIEHGSGLSQAPKVLRRRLVLQAICQRLFRRHHWFLAMLT